MEAWPDKFPRPKRNLSGGLVPAVVSSTMDTGRPRQRVRFQTPYYQYPVTFQMDDATMALFQAWHLYKIKNGKATFEITFPTGAGGEQTVEAFMLKGVFNAVYKDVMNWEVSFTLCIFDNGVMTEAEYDDLIDA